MSIVLSHLVCGNLLYRDRKQIRSLQPRAHAGLLQAQIHLPNPPQLWAARVAGFLHKLLQTKVGLRYGPRCIWGFCCLAENEPMMGKTKINEEQQLPLHPQRCYSWNHVLSPVVLNQHEIPCVRHHNSPISESVNAEETKVKRKLLQDSWCKRISCLQDGGRNWPHYPFAPLPSKIQTNSLYHLGGDSF